MPNVLTHCKGKIRYVEERTATKMRDATARHSNGKAGVLEVYRCHICGFWHVGHRRPEWTR